MHFYCVFLDEKVKNIDFELTRTGFSQNMTAITQHAIVEKRADEGMLFPFLFPLFMFRLEFKAYGDAPHVL